MIKPYLSIFAKQVSESAVFLDQHCFAWKRLSVKEKKLFLPYNGSNYALFLLKYYTFKVIII